MTAQLPADLASLLDGSRIEERVGETILVLANGDDGRPRVATVSVGELLAVTSTVLLLTLYAASRTTGAVRASGGGLLLVARKGGITRVVFSASECDSDDADRVVFRCDVERVEIDAVPYARVTHGIGFELLDADAVLPRWRSQLAQLHELARQELER